MQNAKSVLSFNEIYFVNICDWKVWTLYRTIYSKSGSHSFCIL